jgi:hypothetical protein
MEGVCRISMPQGGTHSDLFSLTIADCAYLHFASSSTCPSCGKNLGPDDFMDLCIADGPPNPKEERKKFYQKIFTRGSSSAGSQILDKADLCCKVLELHEQAKKLSHFVLKQYNLESSKCGKSSGQMAEAFRQANAEITKLRQQNSRHQQDADENQLATNTKLATFHAKLVETQRAVAEARSMVDKKEQQIQEFRQRYASGGMASFPSSPSAHRGGSSRDSRGSRGSRGSHGSHGSHGSGGLGNRDQHVHRPFSGDMAPSPPLRHAVHNSRHHESRRDYPMGVNPTPIQIAPSFDSSRSTLGRIRDVSPTSAYVFTSGTNPRGPLHRSDSRSYGRSSGGLLGGRR